MANCKKCGKAIDSKFRRKYCSEGCSYLANLDARPNYHHAVKVEKVHNATYFDWRDYPFGVIA